MVHARDSDLGARRLWIAFAVGSAGRIVVDAGARRALEERRISLLPAGVVQVDGTWEAGSAVELCDPTGTVFAKGMVRHDSALLRAHMGMRTSELPEGMAHEVIHTDDLVVLPA